VLKSTDAKLNTTLLHKRNEERTMRITLFGAGGGEVTGSAYVVESGKSKILIDCGLFQGVPNADQKNRIAERFTFRNLDSVLLTHAHLDHTGRLPILAQRKYAGSVYCTDATADLAGLILRDAAKIQAGDILRLNRRRQREGKPPIDPLYSPQDVEAIGGRFRCVAYDKPIPVAPGIEARWIEAGHLLGSASIQLTANEQGRKKTIVFSGDLGQQGAPLTRYAGVVDKADAVFLESTYGDRNHRPFKETVSEFIDIVRLASQRAGKILVPTFAVGRAQLLVVLLAWLFRKGEVKPFPIYLDSPMAVEASKIYLKHPDLWHERLKEVVRERPLREELQKTKSKLCVTAEQSRALNDVAGTCMILAGAGMCNAGRILHHLRNNVWKSQTSVLIVGYQGRATVGRALVEGAKEIRIFGEKIAVRASVHSLGGFSAHAGQSELLDWLSPMTSSKPRVFLTHGEDRGRQALAACIEQRFRIKAELPSGREVIEI
jgi:metallo-beta-lactamase family protein